MKFFSLLNNQGTAATETMMCEPCHDDGNKRVIVVNQAHVDVTLEKGFVDISSNDVACCVICGAAHPNFPRDGIETLLADVSAVPTQRTKE